MHADLEAMLMGSMVNNTQVSRILFNRLQNTRAQLAEREKEIEALKARVSEDAGRDV